MTDFKPWPEHQNPTRPDRIASAPYNFVPLPEKIISAVSDVKELPNHDEYDRKCLSGYFDVTLTTRSPLYIRGPVSASDFPRLEQDPQIKNKPEFFHTGDESKPVIPGSSLRGMLRGLLEIVSYSKMQWVSEKHLFFRTVDISTIGEDYRERMAEHVETGFLTRQGDIYSIKTCAMARVWRSRIGNTLYDGTGPNKVPRWQNQQGQPLQYAPVWVKLQGTANSIEELSYEKREGMREGRLVITGDMPGNPGKQKEFVFFLPTNDAKEIPVPDEIINRFHDDDQLTQWQAKAFPTNQPVPRYREREGMLGRKPVPPGDPIFFLREKGKLTFIGRAHMFRLPYMQSPFGLVPTALRYPKDIDYAEALFGFVRTQQQLKDWGAEPPKQGEKGRAYAGRVVVTDAVLQSDQDRTSIWLAGDQEKALVPKILASPKPTAFQHYLTQQRPDQKDKLNHYDSKPSRDGHPTTTIRGHKLYWHQGLDTDQNAQQRLTLEQIRKTISDGFAVPEKPLTTQQTSIKPLKPGVTFSFRVHFENLSDRELGALCWTLHPRGEPGQRYCHHLGMGKPLGMGAVELHAQLHLINRVQRYNTLFSGDAWQSGEDLAAPEEVERLTTAFEQHLLHELKPDRKCEQLKDMRRIAMLLKLLEWPGHRAVEDGNRYLETEKRPNTRYMKIQGRYGNEYRYRPVLPDPTQFGRTSFDGKARPQGGDRDDGPVPPTRHPALALPAKDPDMQKVEDAKRGLEVLREREVAGQISHYHQQWQQLKSTEARKLLAQAIVEKVRKANREKQSEGKSWYQELLAFLAEK